mgnify:CR=1 FL=1
MATVVLDGYTYVVIKRHYAANGRKSVDALTDEPNVVATINVPEVPLAPNEAIIKTYSENEGILEALVEAGVVRPTGRMADIGGHIPPQPVVEVLI